MTTHHTDRESLVQRLRKEADKQAFKPMTLLLREAADALSHPAGSLGGEELEHRLSLAFTSGYIERSPDKHLTVGELGARARAYAKAFVGSRFRDELAAGVERQATAYHVNPPSFETWKRERLNEIEEDHSNFLKRWSAVIDASFKTEKKQ